MSNRATFRTAALAILLLGAASGLGAAVLRVPSDHPTIAAAVARASKGDTVLVDDGVYLECNIEITKDIVVRAANTFGAVIYGSRRATDAIFVVRAAARLEGFVLKGAATGILQRGSPDVEWQASDLALIDCLTGISINDASDNIGSARVRGVAIFGGQESRGIETNDAGRIDVSDCLVANCQVAFQGYDHLSFRVRGGVVLDCNRVIEEGSAYQPVPPATSHIELGEGLRVMGAADLNEPAALEEFLAFLGRSVFDDGGQDGRSAAEATAAAPVVALIEGGILSAQGRYDAASAIYEKAFEAAHKVGSAEFSWQAKLGLARATAAGGNATEKDREIDAALARYREAVDLLEKWHPAVPMGLHWIDFLADKVQAYEELIGLLLDRHAADPSGGWDQLAFDYSERYRGMARLPALRARGRGPGADPALKEISALQLRLQDPGLDGEAKDALLGRLERAEQDYHGALVADERAAFGEEGPGGEGSRGSGTGPAFPRGFQSVRDRLNDRALLSYVLGEKGSYAFLATEAGLETRRLPAAARIEGLIEPYLRFLQLAGTKDFSGAKAGRLLFDLLVGPFADQLRSGPRRIIIVPDGRLHYLPFETLVAAGGTEKGAPPVFWAESVEISYAVSVACGLDSRPWSTAGVWSRGDAAILAVGCSDGIRCDNRSRYQKRFFRPLAYVGREIRALAGLFKGRDVTTLVDDEAGEARLKAEDLERYGIVHLAAHGVIDDTEWWRSALLLGPDAERGEDGFLTALEISRLELRGGLVVLSGCGTGAGRLYEGEGLRGLCGAFRTAGAAYLVVSLWNVDDRATARLMERFYRALAAGASPAEALAGAKRQMIEAGYRNPFYWAPFVLIGNVIGPVGAGGGTGPSGRPIR